MLLNMKKDVQKQNITDDENEDYGVSDQEIIRIARQRRKNKKDSTNVNNVSEKSTTTQLREDRTVLFMEKTSVTCVTKSHELI